MTSDYATMTSAHADSLEEAGRSMMALAERLYPICRAETGPGVRETLALLAEDLPLTVHEVSTGSQFFGWTVPSEWSVCDAYVKDETGCRVIDFQCSNLHLINGSAPFEGRIAWCDLREHLVTLPAHPDWIPFQKCSAGSRWGFCLSHNQYLELESRGDDRTYDVCIDSKIYDGSLTYGEIVLPGETTDEVLLSTHICHPSLANDGLSGIVVASYLASMLYKRNNKKTYRFLFIPATIGAIVWLGQHEEISSRIGHGLVLSCVGDSGGFTYQKSRRGNAPIDRAMAHLLGSYPDTRVRPFEPFGYDQRQFCSPGFNLPVGSLMRSPYQEFPEYHTSADDLSLIQPDQLAGTVEVLLRLFDIIEQNAVYINQPPKCEARLGPLGLYNGYQANGENLAAERAALWLLNLSDGDHDLLAIAERSGVAFSLLHDVAGLLKKHGLLKKTNESADLASHLLNGSLS